MVKIIFTQCDSCGKDITQTIYKLSDSHNRVFDFCCWGELITYVEKYRLYLKNLKFPITIDVIL